MENMLSIDVWCIVEEETRKGIIMASKGYLKERDFSALGGVRGIAMCWLCFFYRYALLFGWKLSGTNGRLYRLIWDGYLLVELFFFLSGFFSYMKYNEKIQNGMLAFGSYVKRKITKLYPLMIVTALVCTIIQLTTLFITGESGFSNIISLSGIIISCLGLQCGYFNDGGIYSNPTEWYLSVLMLCYVLFWFVCRIKNEDLKRLTLMSWAVLGCALMMKPLNWCLLYESNGRGYFSFAVGVIFAEIFGSFSMDKKKYRVALSSFVMVITAVIWLEYREFIGSANFVVAVLISPVVIILAAESHIAKRVLNLKLFRFYGKISFSLFLWSFPFDMAIWGILHITGNAVWLDTVWFWVVHIVLMTAIAYASHCLLEGGLQRLILQTALKK